MDNTRLEKIISDHELWLNDEGGSRADLSGANLSRANLGCADLGCADLSCANLGCADLGCANLSGANLSGVKNLLSAISYIDAHFERTTDGYIAYKTFGGQYQAPDTWKIEPGAVIEETPNPDRGTPCGSGINVAPLAWVRKNYSGKPIWKLLIRWEWLPGVVVPFATDGKIRCERAELIGIVEGD